MGASGARGARGGGVAASLAVRAILATHMPAAPCKPCPCPPTATCERMHVHHTPLRMAPELLPLLHVLNHRADPGEAHPAGCWPPRATTSDAPPPTPPPTPPTHPPTHHTTPPHLTSTLPSLAGLSKAKAEYLARAIDDSVRNH